MKQIIHILVATAFITLSTSVYAQETLSGINLSDFQQLKQLACTGNNSDPQLTASLDELQSTITQTLNLYGIEFTDEQLEYAYNQAAQVQSQLEAENTVQQFCADY